MDSPKCVSCSFYGSPDIGMEKECCFPWFDWTEEDKRLMACGGEGKEND